MTEFWEGFWWGIGALLMFEIAFIATTVWVVR
jgi:hypothetical protein